MTQLGTLAVAAAVAPAAAAGGTEAPNLQEGEGRRPEAAASEVATQASAPVQPSGQSATTAGAETRGVAPVQPSRPDQRRSGTRKVNPQRPAIIQAVPAPDEVNSSVDTFITNLTLAGLTLLFIIATAHIFNSTIEENRHKIDAFLGWVLRPCRRAGTALASLAVFAVRHAGDKASRVFWPLAVLALTVLIYGFAEPGFGLNFESATVAVAVLVCAGGITYIRAGGQALTARRLFHMNLGVRPFPFAILIASVNVLIARLLNFEPGVIYGFVGMAVFLTPTNATRGQIGRITFWPCLVLLVVSVLAWIAVVPLRDLGDTTGSREIVFFEGISVEFFVGGLEGLFFTLIPVSFMEGDRIWRWNKKAWLLLAGSTSFLFWYALLNSDKAYLDTLDQGRPAGVLLIGVACVVISLLTWGFFRLLASVTKATARVDLSDPRAAGLTIAARPGQKLTLRVRAMAHAHCSISYVLPSGTESRARGLVPKIADDRGNVQWTWRISPGTEKGIGVARVACGDQALTVTVDIE
jgi:hypothetical protein